ncbi:cytochrome P450 89A2-like [Silene latifolia]|uniref:cytochrome P450 89A2-like n=1 Tax=Silene latifolia TaxID=37657 RepID=UPI003D789E4C
MELWLLITVTAFIAVLITAYSSTSNSKPKSKWPPGPTYLPIITQISWLRKTSLQAESTLRSLRDKFGPIVTISSNPARPVIYIFNHELAHQALVQNGAVFADRPKPLPIVKIVSSNQHNITFSSYGPFWRLLRRNLTSMMLHSSRIKDFSFARKWVLEDILVSGLKGTSESGNGVVQVIDHFRFAMFGLLVVMCFGDKLDESQIKEIERVQQGLLISLLTRFRILNLKPWLTRVLLKGRWDEFFELKKEQADVLLTHIAARKKLQNEIEKSGLSLVTCYVDSLLKLEIPEEGNRKLSEDELVAACSEFLNAGTDTTATTLQWIMANMVKNPEIQTRVFEEIKAVIGNQAEEVKEDDLSDMSYLKAVVLEGLRRHPPGHSLLPHAVTKEVELGGYIVPKNAVVNFAVAEMGWDPVLWEDPMEFNPERFMSGQDEFDITGSREIKMMPFGVGRRICPGLGLALLHLEYFVANLVWKFEWMGVEGHEVDLSEKQEFTIVMKNPLHARISPRFTR